jgi:large subunit ribosomal protein L15e
LPESKTLKNGGIKMGMYKHIRELWKSPKENLKEVWKNRLIQFRREPVTLRIERPTRLDKARSLGYKAKQGIIIVRQRVLRGGHIRPDIKGGRKPKNSRQSMVGAKNYQRIAEERANKKYVNCEVMNSYLVAHDGKHLWYEIILVDRDSPQVRADKNISWITQDHHHKRAYRGLTSAGKKGRGLRNKGKGAEKIRPSIRANKGRGK